LEITDFIPENKQVYYLYMPDEAERQRLKTLNKPPTLELPQPI
jgi:hypothetical protein